MPFWELFIIAVGLSMDAFAVALGKGLQMPRLAYRRMLVIAFFFGVFQALMPVIGWFLGDRFATYIADFDHWVAFILLVLIGANMIRESLSNREEKEVEHEKPFDLKEMLLLSIATSIDALAVGISFGLLEVNIALSATVIGITTFLISVGGVFIGFKFGIKYRKYAEIAGGIILICVGIKILIEHLFF